jgi:hypothetical protein
MNGMGASCCTAVCTFQPKAAACLDDGSACTLDVCDGASTTCRHPPAPADSVCRQAADACDAVETCDGMTADCPRDARKPDADGDGLCDETDPCTDVGGAQTFVATGRRQVTLSRINTEPTAGNDALALAAVFPLAAGGAFGAIDPAAQGARVLVWSNGGALRLDALLAAAPYGGRGTAGWQVNRTRTTWRFKDATGAAASGITAARIVDVGRKAARHVSVALRGTRSTYPIVAGDEPLRVAVVLGDQAAAASGYCGESAYVAGDCVFNRRGSVLTCDPPR